MKQILRKPGICQNPSGNEFRKFDVEKLDEEAVEKLIRGCASGPMIRSRLNPASGSLEHFVVLLAMSPDQGGEKKAGKQEEQQSDLDREPRPEVNIYGKHINTFHFLGAWPCVQRGGKGEKGKEEREAGESKAGCSWTMGEGAS